MNKNIYIKKINTVGDYVVWLVDGALIRKETNENFVKCSINNKSDFVPKNEFWIDEDLDPKEYHYFIDRFIYERGLLDSGKDYATADKKADKFEKKSVKVQQKSEGSQNQILIKKICWKKSKRK